jgi:hypothetical protein
MCSSCIQAPRSYSERFGAGARPVHPILRQLIEQDLQIILARKPEMRPAVLVAYATASAEGKHLIESIVQEADPSFLMQLQKKTP